MKKLWSLFFCVLIFLTGCVRYEVGVNFSQANSGTIIQHIKLGEQLTNFNQIEANAWLNSIEKRAIKLQGKSKRISPEELVVTVPFASGKELVAKFNQFFNSADLPQQEKPDRSAELLELKGEMSIEQSNLLFLERNVLKFNADLRPLAVISNQGNVIISPGDLIDLQIQFNFPWGAKLSGEDLSLLETSSDRQLNLRLQPGQLNEIIAIFWLPNYVGLGTLAIALFILAGFYLKYRQLPLIDN